MATVAELVEDISEIMGVKPETVNAYARALIDSGDLPKSRGRAIAHVEVEHIVKLFLAVAIAPKIKNAAIEVHKYFEMSRAGYPGGLQSEDRVIAGKEICAVVETILTYDENASDEEKEFRKQCILSQIAITLNWQEIEIHIREGILRFKDGGDPNYWGGYVKRTVTISGQAFGMLGHANGRDYVKES
ncbi:hypothetical protein [Alloyangia pacifica]|uniref:hypothetical protein n=1 Tax=Alloyangia pacifica TaxID=311180 RepID=UPI001CFD56B8|nr:hypothetical protein [Alloyangia pacifica]